MRRRFFTDNPIGQHFLGISLAFILFVVFGAILLTTWRHWRVEEDYTTRQALVSFGIAWALGAMAMALLIATLKT